MSVSIDSIGIGITLHCKDKDVDDVISKLPSWYEEYYHITPTIEGIHIVKKL